MGGWVGPMRLLTALSTVTGGLSALNGGQGPRTLFQLSDEIAPPQRPSLTPGSYYPACHPVYFLVARTEISSGPFVHLAIVCLPTLHWNVSSREQGPHLHRLPEMSTLCPHKAGTWEWSLW